MHLSSIIRFFLAAVLLAPAFAKPIEPSVTASPVASSHVPSPSSGELVTVYGTVGTPVPVPPEENITVDFAPAETEDELASPIQKRSYAGSCDSCSLQGGSRDHLNCRCRAENQSWIWTQINLNLCLMNDDSWLRWKYNGNFIHGCIVISLAGTTLSAECRDHSLDYYWTSINLDANIHNWNGILNCVVPA
ncbi:Cyanovirin-N [Naviculisporaceae sp. PSN 640]